MEKCRKYPWYECDGCHCCEEISSDDVVNNIYDHDPDVFHQYNTAPTVVSVVEEDELPF